jgi:peptidoglycan hydrolase-like protein with peptidoglycan-binding domain
MPRSIFLALFLAGLCAALPCGWPVVYSNGRVAHAQTAMVQRMLNAVLPANLTVDGDFGPQTTAAVQQFETAAGLKPNGIMDLLSWPPLVAKAGDVVYGASGDLVLAVQVWSACFVFAIVLTTGVKQVVLFVGLCRPR